MFPRRSGFLKILCGILMLQLSLAGNIASGNDQPFTNLGHGRQIPNDIQEILRKIQRCSELPTCDDPSIPLEARGNLRTGMPAQCQLTESEKTRLRDYYDSLHVTSGAALTARMAANAGGIAAFTILGVYLTGLLTHTLEHQYDFSTNSIWAIGLSLCLLNVAAAVALTYNTGSLLYSRTLRSDLDRSLHNIGVDPRNLERALAQIPRRSWVTSLFSSTRSRLTQGSRGSRFRNALPRFLRRTATAIPTTARNTAAPANILPRETPALSNSSEAAQASTSAGAPAVPPTRVRVCVPNEAVASAADELADEMLDVIVAGANAPASGQRQVGRVHSEVPHSGPSAVPLPTITPQGSISPDTRPSATMRGRRRIVRDLRRTHEGAYSGAVGVSRDVFSETPALVPGAAAGASESLVPAIVH